MHRPLVLAALASLAAASCSAERPKVGLDLPVVSRYVFRGAVLNEDPVVQPDLHLEWETEQEGTLTLGVWSNLDTTDATDHAGEFTEVDLYVDWSTQVDVLGVSLGAVRYEYPQSGGDASAEAYVLLSLPDLPVVPAVELWYDFDALDSAYWNVNLSRELEPAQDWRCGLLAGVGAMGRGQAEASFGVAESGLSDLLLQGWVEHPLSEHVSLTGVAAFARALDGDYRDAVDDPDNLWFALGVAFAF